MLVLKLSSLQKLFLFNYQLDKFIVSKSLHNFIWGKRTNFVMGKNGDEIVISDRVNE